MRTKRDHIDIDKDLAATDQSEIVRIKAALFHLNKSYFFDEKG